MKYLERIPCNKCITKAIHGFVYYVDLYFKIFLKGKQFENRFRETTLGKMLCNA